MSDKKFASQFDAFGASAKLSTDTTVRAGRYSVQKSAERRIFADVASKLRPQPHERGLDIGCGSGLLSIPLAAIMDEVVGIDHPEMIDVMSKSIAMPNLKLVGGGFPDVDIEGEFDIIIAYSVVQCLPSIEAITDFILAAAARLSRGGRLMIGDMPNIDRKTRFQNSERGKKFEAEWRALVQSHATESGEDATFKELTSAKMLGTFNDEQILALMQTLRLKGYDSFLAQQPRDLPFGNTREDLIVERP